MQSAFEAARIALVNALRYHGVRLPPSSPQRLIMSDIKTPCLFAITLALLTLGCGSKALHSITITPATPIEAGRNQTGQAAAIPHTGAPPAPAVTVSRTLAENGSAVTLDTTQAPGTPDSVLIPLVQATGTASATGIGELATAALAPHPALTITYHQGVQFRPNAGSRYGIVFYPGGNVAPEAYAPVARAWALAGYTVCIPAMPRQMAIYAPNRATAVMQCYPEVDSWVIGGHSLGGVTASVYAAWHQRRIAGLFLFAAVPGPTVSLARSSLPVLSLYGTNDARVPLAEVSADSHRLPPHARIIGLAGANHGQFGDYGKHPNDGVATLPRERQHDLVATTTLTWLEQVWGNPPRN